MIVSSLLWYGIAAGLEVPAFEERLDVGDDPLQHLAVPTIENAVPLGGQVPEQAPGRLTVR